MRERERERGMKEREIERHERERDREACGRERETERHETESRGGMRERDLQDAVLALGGYGPQRWSGVNRHFQFT